MDKKRQYQKIIANFILLIAITLSIIFIFPYLIYLFLPFVLGYIIAICVEPIILFLENRIKIKRKHGTFLIIVSVLSVLFIIIYFIIKRLYLLIINIANNTSLITSTISDISEKISNIASKNHLDENIDKIVSHFTNSTNVFIKNISNYILEYTGNFISHIPMAIIILILTFVSAYIFIKKNVNYTDKLVKRFPKLQIIKKEVIDVFNNYMKAQFKIMFIIFLILLVGFGILKVKYFILIAFLVALVDLLPIFGTGTIIFPWIVISLLYGEYTKAIGLFIIYIIALISHQALQPKLISESIGLPILPTLILMFVGYRICGVVGLLIFPPLGLVVYKLYKLGFFDNYKKSIIIIYNDLKEFLKL